MYIDFLFIIYQAGAAQLGTEEAEINSILCVRSFDHLRAVFDKYEELSEGTSLEDAIKSETSSDLQDGFLSISMLQFYLIIYG